MIRNLFAMAGLGLAVVSTPLVSAEPATAAPRATKSILVETKLEDPTDQLNQCQMDIYYLCFVQTGDAAHCVYVARNAFDCPQG